MKCKHLVLSSGGLKAYAFLGPCKKLDLSKLESVSGSSAGSIVGLLICLTKGDINAAIEYASEEENIFIKKDDINIRCFMSQYGVNDGSRIVNVCEDALEEYVGKRRLTFKELYDFCGIHYYVTVSNMTRKKRVVYCYKDTPDMDVATAVRMSTAIPFYFTSVLYENEHYVDGAIFSNLPYEPILKYHDPKPDDSVLIRIRNNEKCEIKSILDYIISFAEMIVHINTIPETDINKKFTIIGVETSDIPFISHNFTKDAIQDCIAKGETCWN